MQKSFILILFVFSTVFCFAQTGEKQHRTIPGELIIKLKKDIDRNDLISDVNLRFLSSSYDLEVTPMFPASRAPERMKDEHGNELVDLTRFYSLRLDEQLTTSTCIALLMKTGLIEYAEERYIPELLYDPNDPSTGSQYYLDKIQAYDAWDVAQGDTSMVIAIVDTGMDMDHEDFIYNIAYNYNDPLDGLDNDNDGFVDNFRGWDMGDNDNFPQNEMNEHGTLCAGLASAHTDNGLGIAGPGFKCRLLPVKVQDSDTLLTYAYEGLVYAAEQGAQVINCSWGNTHFARFEQDMVNYAAINKDALVVAACGNNNNIVNFYPASYDNVLSVAAITPQDQKWTPENTGTNGGSSFGYHVDVSAPGTLVYSTQDGGGYRTLTAGTSFACPIVAGVGGVLRAQHPEMSALQCIEHLKNSTDVIDTIEYNLPWQNLLGTGRINMFKTVTEEFQPGLILRDIVVFDDRENDYQNSRLVEVHGEMYNYLASASDVEVSLSMVTDNASLIGSSFSLGSIDSLTSVAVQGDMIQLELDADFDNDDQLVIRMDITDGEYHRIQYIEFYVAPSFEIISTGELELTVPASGRFGYVDLFRLSGEGMNYHEFVDVFYDSGWMIGNGETKIVAAVREQSEFEMIEASEKMESDVADEAVRSVFKALDVEASLNLQFDQVVYAWYDIPNAFMIHAEICNENIVPVDGLYAGIFTDWELVKYSRNIVSWDETYEIAYAEHTGEVNLYAGYVLLSEQGMNHYALDQRFNSDGLVDLTNGLSEEEKYYCMTHTKHTAGEGEGTDVAQIFSAGPFDLEGQDTARVVMGVIVAQSLVEMQAAADSLRSRYDEMYPDDSSIEGLGNNVFRLYPNPSDGKVCLQLKQESEIKIMNIAGKLVFDERLSEGAHNLHLELPSGQYTVSMSNANWFQNQKLIICN